MAQIRREFDTEGNPMICGDVVVEEGKIWSLAIDPAELADNLDMICKMKLDQGIHGIPVKIFLIANSPCIMN
jgi:hypothetical protein